MVLEFQKKERFQTVLRESIIQACLDNFGCKCTVDGIICVTVNLPGGNTDEIIAKFHEELNEATNSLRLNAYTPTQANNKNKYILLANQTPGLKHFLPAPYKDVHVNKPCMGKPTTAFKEISRQLLLDNERSSPKNDSMNNASEVQFACSMCLDKFVTYKELEKHFKDVHSSSITHFCEFCSIGFESEADCATHRQNIHNIKSEAVDVNNTSKVSINRRKQTKPRKGIAEGNNDEGLSNVVTVWTNPEEADDTVSLANSQDNLKDELMHENNNDLNQRNHNDFGEMSDRGMASEDLSSPEEFTRLLNNTREQFHCSNCGEAFEIFSQLDEHCYSAHKLYICSHCHITFAQRANRDKHIYQKHSGMKPFPCSTCDASFTRRDALKKHTPKCKGILLTTSFSPSSTRNSPLTSKYSILEATLQMKTMENASLDGSIKMEVDDVDCGLDLSHGSRMKGNHMDANQSSFSYHDKEMLGNMTPQGNPSNQNSEEEEDRSSNDRLMFSRSAEDGRSDSPSQLASRSRKYKCDRCDVQVVGGTAFEDHCKLAHRRTPCLHCGKTFSQKGNMERHKRQHTGERPFTCPECSCSYTRRETLKSHMSQSHGMQLPQPQQQIRQLRQGSQMSPLIIGGASYLMQSLTDSTMENQSYEEDGGENASSE